jgi:hypothetical protein
VTAASRRCLRQPSIALTTLALVMLAILVTILAPAASAQSSPTPTQSPSSLPSGQTPPSPLGGLAPFGLVIGIVLIGGVSVFYGRRNQ